MFHPTRRTLFATLAAAALSITATSAFAAEDTFEKNFSFSGTPTISVSTGSGYIHVSPGSDNQFHIVGHVRANSGWLSSGNPDAAVKQIIANPPITQAGNIITIGRMESSSFFNNISISYDISTPRSTLLTAHTGSGEVRIDGISGAVTADSGSGSVHLSLANSGDVHTHTGSGSIHVEGAIGGLRAGTGSGSIEVAGNVGTDWNLTTGSGSIRIKLPDNARFNFNAGTGSGSIHVSQPIVMQGSLNHHHVAGTVNGGGPTLRASTGSGSITVD